MKKITRLAAEVEAELEGSGIANPPLPKKSPAIQWNAGLIVAPNRAWKAKLDARGNHCTHYRPHVNPLKGKGGVRSLGRA